MTQHLALWHFATKFWNRTRYTFKDSKKERGERRKGRKDEKGFINILGKDLLLDMNYINLFALPFQSQIGNSTEMKIFIKGTVQGVGFRPTVYRVAKSLGLRGYVLNKGSNVEIGIKENKDVEDFLNSLMKKLPPLAAIEEIEIKDDSISGFEDFKIMNSSKGEKTSVTPVDTAICEECVRELFDEDNRRYLYPFINCTSCGARFSVIENVPYDRANTSMHEFEMCEKCLAEYTNPMDRRFHAQTISCPGCGPKYTLYGKEKGVGCSAI